MALVMVLTCRPSSWRPGPAREGSSSMSSPACHRYPSTATGPAIASSALPPPNGSRLRLLSFLVEAKRTGSGWPQSPPRKDCEAGNGSTAGSALEVRRDRAGDFPRRLLCASTSTSRCVWMTDYGQVGAAPPNAEPRCQDQQALPPRSGRSEATSLGWPCRTVEALVGFADVVPRNAVLVPAGFALAGVTMVVDTRLLVRVVSASVAPPVHVWRTRLGNRAARTPT